MVERSFYLVHISFSRIEETPSSGKGLTRVTLKSSTADNGPATDLILCNLHYPSCLQQPLDIELYDGQTLSFAVKGPRKSSAMRHFTDA